ncbi:MAG: nucleotidyltransferase domain-containing protein [Cyanobacteriota bacterium]|nr:nucleotidyltransferase domain-containing protein [Cyanobacteriota bacterium]
MGKTVAEIRRRKQAERLKAPRQQANNLLIDQPGGSLWLFGSWARGDWDCFSDVDVVAVAPNCSQASGLADAVLHQGMADDVPALTEQEWLECRDGADPSWRAIGRDAVRLGLS